MSADSPCAQSETRQARRTPPRPEAGRAPSNVPVWRLASAAASARRAWTIGSGLRAAARSECRSRREAAASLRASCGTLQFGRHAFVWPGSGEGAVPGATLGGELGIAHLRQCVVDAPSLVEGRGSIDRERTSGW